MQELHINLIVLQVSYETYGDGAHGIIIPRVHRHDRTALTSIGKTLGQTYQSNFPNIEITISMSKRIYLNMDNDLKDFLI